MYLSKLELHGFKSFATPTVLSFDPGITAIVGPNGCGKSNIVDAVRWVIGEQRARILRSEKMENVIFNGTSKRRPLGMAEVQLTIENTRGVLPTEYSEVTLGRRLYRSGESEYLLNNVPCRLKDIVDLFMDTGMGAGAYSVIELKMVEDILSDNAQDRRHLFEEAAGITKYKLRRTQALRKLDGTQADLTRLRDLTEEIEKRVHSLKRQAAKASRFQDYEDRLHHLELALAQVEHDRLTEQQRQLDAEVLRINDELEEHTARMAKDEAQLEALRTRLVEHEQTLSTCQQRLNEHETHVRALEADLRLEHERLDNARREHERMISEQEDAHNQREALNERVALLTEELAAAEPLRADAERVLREAETARDDARSEAEIRRQALHALRRDEHTTLEARAAHQRKLDRLSNRIDLLISERDRLREALKATHNHTREHDAEVQQAQDVLQQAADTRAEADEQFTTAEQEHDVLRRQLEEASERLRRLERQHDATAAEAQVLESLVASFDEFSDAVQFLATSPSWTPDRLQTVADVLACDDGHRAALDAALGDLGSCLVVRSEQEALQAASLLRAEHKGQATFLILDRLRPLQKLSPNGSASGNGAPTPMAALVRPEDDAFEPLVHVLLHNCYYAETLEHAQILAETSADPGRFIAASGEWVDARGLVHAGSIQTDASPVASRIGRREHLKNIRYQLDALKADLAQATEKQENIESALNVLPLDARRQALKQAEHAHAEAERTYTRLTYERETARRQQADMSSRLARLMDEITAQQAEVDPLQDAVDQAEEQLALLRTQRDEAEHAFQDAEAASRAAQDRFSEATIAAVQARNRCDNIQHDLDRTHQDLDVLARRAEERTVRLAALLQTIEQTDEQQHAIRQQLDETRAERSGLEDKVAQARTALLQTRVDIDTVEARLRKLRQAREQSIREENVRAVRQAEIQTRKDDLLAGVLDNFGFSLAEEPVSIEEGFDVAAAREEVQDLRRKIKGMGQINALALEEYEEEKTRFEFLMEQQADLERAETTLLETIDEINTTAAARFQETYEAIRESFRGLFSELFGQEASADLSLADSDDPLESPIDIMAKPRGKRPVSISQLSSGEKTLTAIALLFAIYLVKPSPFCILDEVDAPLDDANVDRFMRLIRRFSENTQFIIVTHNKRTMELADQLYGITMQEQGVSRLVGVKFEEALEIAG